MRRAAFEKLAKSHLLPALPNFNAHGVDVYERNAQWVLREFFFESSPSKHNAFYVNAAIIPLFQLERGLFFSQRVGSGWDLVEEMRDFVMSDVLTAIRDEGVPFLQRVRSLDDFVAEGPKLAFDDNLEQPYIAELVAYAKLLRGDPHGARQLLDRVSEEARGGEWASFQPELVAASADRAQTIREKLDVSIEAAVKTLLEWRSLKIRELDIPFDDVAEVPVPL